MTKSEPPSAAIVPPGSEINPATKRLNLAWTGENTLEGRFPIHKSGVYVGAVDLGQGRFLPLAPLMLPYSPEYEPQQDPDAGRKNLVELARITGGMERTSWNGVFNPSLLRRRQLRDLVIPLALLLLLLHLTEVAARRMYFFTAADAWLGSLRMPKFRRVRRPKIAVQTEQPKEPSTPITAPPQPVESPLARAKAKARDRLS